jgi:hypothetical protein
LEVASPSSYRIAVIGNGPVDSRSSAEIDAHDLVIRFNACRHYGRAGRKIDVLVLSNTGSPATKFARHDKAINREALASAKSFWLARAPELVSAERILHPGDSRCWVTCDEEIIHKCVGNRPWQYIPAETYRLAKRNLDRYGARFDDHPSTGMLALFHIRRALRRRFRSCRATLYGFTHQGWYRHPWAAERALIDRWRNWVARA